MKKLKSKNSWLQTQTLFYVFMILSFIGIIIFGMSKFFFIEKTISQSDKLTLINEVKSSFKKCEDPLNKGSISTLKHSKNTFNSICLFDDENKINDVFLNDFEDDTIKDDLRNDLKKIIGTENNLIFLDLKTITKSGKISLNSYEIIQTEKIEYKQNRCYTNLENSQIKTFRIEC